MCFAKEFETYLNDEQIAQIQELADKQGKPFEEVLGEIVKGELERKTKPSNKGKLRCFIGKKP